MKLLTNNFNMKDFANFVCRKYYGFGLGKYEIEIKDLSYWGALGTFEGLCAGEPVGYPEECEIAIDERFYKEFLDSKDDINETLWMVATITHEISHFALWFQGLEYADESIEFEKKAEEIGFPSNYSIDLNVEKMKNLLDEYLEKRPREIIL